MINLKDIRYVRLGIRDLDVATSYVTGVVGLDVARSEAGARYFRSDGRDHTLVYVEGESTDQAVGFDVADKASLDGAGALLSDAGLPVAWGSRDACDVRGVEALVSFRDLTGNMIELVYAPSQATTSSTEGRHGITGFSHIGLCTSNAPRDERLWTGRLGARVSDWIGAAPLLRIDAVHHKIALFPAHRAGVQHINHQVASIDDVMQAWYRLRQAGIRVVFGPGRHPSSGAVFLYFEGPDGMIFEYSTGVRHIAPEEEADYRPRALPLCNESFCMWGSVPDIREFQQ